MFGKLFKALQRSRSGIADIFKIFAEGNPSLSKLEELEELAELNVDRLVFTIWPQDPDAVLLELEGLTDIVDSFVS